MDNRNLKNSKMKILYSFRVCI